MAPYNKLTCHQKVCASSQLACMHISLKLLGYSNHKVLTPVSGFIELVTICYEENLHIVTTIPPSSPQFHQALLRNKELAQTLVC